MIRNYLTTAIRNFRRHKAYSSINVLGLTVGLACTFFIVLWIQSELSYDRFHQDGDRIYAVMRHATFGGTRGTTQSMPKPLAQVLTDDYPEVTNIVLMSWDTEMLLSLDRKAYRSRSRYAGTDLFKVFSFPLILGDESSVLRNPESVAMSATLASKYFGENWRTRDDILGTTFRLDNRIDVTLTGVYEDIPSNSTLQFDFVIPVEEYIRRNDWVEHWGNNGLRMFARVAKGANVTALNAAIKDLIDEHVDQWESDVFMYPYQDLYLKSDFKNGVLVGGRIEYVRIFLLVAIFIILIASINFMNLATARSAQRAKEIGIRKSVGASRSVLARQFLGESVFMALIAFVLAIGLVVLLLPTFNTLTQKSVSITDLNVRVWLELVGIALVTGVLAGSYPAIYLSSFNVVGVLRSSSARTTRGSGLRKGLVVFQFIMSIVLVVGTFTVYRQLSYIRSKDLGIDRDNVVFLNYEGGVKKQFDSFKQELLRLPGIVDVSSSSSNPLDISNDTISVQWDGKDPDDNTLFSNINVGYDFVKTMGIRLDDGRLFSRDFGADSTNYIINWKAAGAMGMEDPVGQTITMWDREGQIIGVVEDFNMASLYRPIQPVIMRLRPEGTNQFYVRLAGGRTTEALAGLERVYRRFNPDYPFDYKFLDDQFEDSYRSEVVIGTLANVFAFVAILIACLGLFGLASFTAEQRTREIGIRKVLGATVPGMVALLSREFLILVTGAFVVAAPIAYYVMNGWLEDFTFHTSLGPGVLAAAGVSAVLIAWLTVGYQAFRAASVNPVLSLRAE